MDDREPRTRARHRGWSVRRYMLLFTVVLLAVAAVAGVAVRTMAQQDAVQSATGDASFAARAAAGEIASEVLLLQQTTANVAGNPQVAVALAGPSGPCSLTFAGDGAFSIGHLDIIKPDGSVTCSSQPIRTRQVYSGASWLAASTRTPLM